MKVRCSRCGADIEEEDAYEVGTEKICEDCYLDMQNSQRPLVRRVRRNF
jgi:formylmethanofuran dehydrogenase subunit E